MDTIRELYHFLEKNTGKIVKSGSATMQIYDRGDQMNLCLSGSESPVIKFEPCDADHCYVAVAYADDPTVINYGKKQAILLDTKISSLETSFPNGYRIGEVIEAMLNWQE